MLINATRATEVRAAILNDGKLDQLEIEHQDSQLLKGNIYKGRVANVEASLNACFVEFGAEKQGFLPLDEINPAAYHIKAKGEGKPRIEDVMRKGRELVVQVVKDPIGNKGAALTTRVSLAGRYIVLMPLDDVRGVSRKISNDSQRKALKEIATSLKVPKEYGFIVRTAGMDRTKTDLNRDAAQLVRAWKDVLKNSKPAKAPQLLYEDSDLVVRMLRDHYSAEVTQVLIDTEEAFQKAHDYFSVVMPRNKGVLTEYGDRVPLFTRYQVERQVEQIFGRRADLKSGGYILIDPTEALISIDVNSGRSTKQKSQEETALHTNLEAAEEIARQLRLRDLGGLIVIDFIDMPSNKSNRQVEKVLKTALKDDKARTYVGKISENGLLEVNRQRLKQALTLRTHRDCPTCEGRGIIPSRDFVAHRLLRSIEAKAANGSFAKVVILLHPELADHVQNTHRRDIVTIEKRFGVLITIEGRPGTHRGEEDVRYVGLGGLTESEKRIVEVMREEIPEQKPFVVRASNPVSIDAEALAEVLQSGPEEEQAEEEGKKKRRRRRRKRKDEGAEGEASVEAASAEGEDAEGQDDGERSAEDGEEGEEGEEAPRRRRRRRRRRGRGRSAEPAAEGEEGAPAAAVEARAEGEEDEDEGDEGDEGEDEEQDENGQPLSRSQKRRIRRKRRRSQEDGELGDDEDTLDGDEDEPEELDLSDLEVIELVAAGPDEDDEDEVEGEEDEDAVAPVDEDDDAGEATSDDGEDEGGAVEQAVEAAAVEATEDGEEPAPRRRRRRRRRKPRAEGEEGGENAQQAAAEPTEVVEEEPEGPPPGVSLIAPPADGLFGDLTEA